MIFLYWAIGMIIVATIIVAAIAIVARGSWDKCPPPAVHKPRECKEPGSIRRVKRARLVGGELVLLDDVEPGDWIEVDAHEYEEFYRKSTEKNER